MTYGLYEVASGHTYKQFAAGDTFEARADRPSVRRAVAREVIRLVATTTPKLEPGSYTFPEGWLSQPTSPDNRGPERAFFIGKE